MQTSLSNDSYNAFLKKFVQVYDQAFLARKIEIKLKNLVSPWIAQGLRWENLQERNSTSMRNSWSKETQKMYKNVHKRCIKIYLKNWKSNQRNHTFKKN